jgi:hypothetical protein
VGGNDDDDDDDDEDLQSGRNGARWEPSAFAKRT